MGKSEKKNGFVKEKDYEIEDAIWAKIDSFSQVSSQRMGENKKKTDL